MVAGVAGLAAVAAAGVWSARRSGPFDGDWTKVSAAGGAVTLELPAVPVSPSPDEFVAEAGGYTFRVAVLPLPAAPADVDATLQAVADLEARRNGGRLAEAVRGTVGGNPSVTLEADAGTGRRETTVVVGPGRVVVVSTSGPDTTSAHRRAAESVTVRSA